MEVTTSENPTETSAVVGVNGTSATFWFPSSTQEAHETLSTSKLSYLILPPSTRRFSDHARQTPESLITSLSVTASIVDSPSPLPHVTTSLMPRLAIARQFSHHHIVNSNSLSNSNGSVIASNLEVIANIGSTNVTASYFTGSKPNVTISHTLSRAWSNTSTMSPSQSDVPYPLNVSLYPRTALS